MSGANFNVVAEFQFHAAEAIIQSKALGGQLEKVAMAADAVNDALKSAAFSLAGQIGLYGGIGGAIYAAVKAADKYEFSQRSIANIFLSNKMFEGPDAFAQAMDQSAKAMENMQMTARKFSLPVTEFVSTAKMIGAGLINHGLDDSSMKVTSNITRGYLKSAPMLGIDASMAQGELMDMINGRANMGARLPQRLVAETAAFKELGHGKGAGGALGKFNAMEPAKRLAVLTEGLTQFGNVAKIVDANAMGMTSQLQRLADNFTGQFSILRPIGDALLQPFKKILFMVNVWLETSGENVAKKLGAMIKMATGDLEGLFATVQQLRSLKKDSKRATHVIEIEGMLAGLTYALRFLGVELRAGLVITGITWIATTLSKIAGWFVGLGGLTVVAGFFRYLAFEAMPQFLVLTSIFQGISRGWAQAEIINGKWIAANMPRLAALADSFRQALSKIMAPFALITEGIADIVQHIFAHEILWGAATTALEGFAAVLSFIGDVVVGVISTISGVMQVLINLVNDIVTLNFDAKWDLPTVFKDGFDVMWDKYHKPAAGVDSSEVAKTNINIDKININNQFKEQMEPDRIAFSLVDQLKRAATNPLQAAGNSMGARAVR